MWYAYCIKFYVVSSFNMTIKNKEQIEKDTRPVRCFICRKKMYYSGHPKHELEYTIFDNRMSGYVHAKCIKALRKVKQK